MPEIDGLRFIAICWVVVLMHLPNIIDTNLYNNQLISNSFIAKWYWKAEMVFPSFL